MQDFSNNENAFDLAPNISFVAIITSLLPKAATHFKLRAHINLSLHANALLQFIVQTLRTCGKFITLKETLTSSM